MEWWQELLVQAVAAGVGAGIAAAVSFRIVRGEREARLQDRADHEAERARDELSRIRSIRSEAVTTFLEGMRLLIDVPEAVIANRAMQMALLRVTFDGTDDSYDVYRWVRQRLEMTLVPSFDSQAQGREFEVIRAMLVGWLRPDDEAGTLASMRAYLSA